MRTNSKEEKENRSELDDAQDQEITLTDTMTECDDDDEYQQDLMFISKPEEPEIPDPIE